jgi:hypothetical protein
MTDDDVEPWVRELVRRQWTRICFGPKAQPIAVAAIHRQHHWADVVVLRGHDHAAAYRAILRPGDDPLTPKHLLWHHTGDAASVLHAILTLTPDDLAETTYPTPPECHIPETRHRPITILLGRS